MAIEGIRAALRAAATRLAESSDTPRLDAELLMAHALGIDRQALLLGADGVVPAEFAALLDRRLAGEPIAYIVGMREFWTIALAVSPAVLIPRPDSETLIDAAVAHFRGRAPSSILDLGTGSGALLLAALAEWPDARGIGIDRSGGALAVARSNAARLGLADRARFVQADWAHGIDARFDLLLCNPPYVESGAVLSRDVADHEPASALFAGADGLDEYRRLASSIARLLMPGGLAAIEIGSGQADAVRALLAAAGSASEVRQDLAGLDRCILVHG